MNDRRPQGIQMFLPKNEPRYSKKVAEVYQGLWAAHSGEMLSEAA